jgi:hypothetical protein
MNIAGGRALGNSLAFTSYFGFMDYPGCIFGHIIRLPKLKPRYIDKPLGSFIQ